MVVLVDKSQISLNAMEFYLNNYHKKGNMLHIFHAVVNPSLPSLDFSPENFTTAKIMAICND